LKAGAKIEATDIYGRMALHLATYKGQSEVIKRLVEQHGADGMAMDNDSTPALDLLAQREHNEWLRYLKSGHK